MNHDVTPEHVAELEQRVDDLSAECAALRDDLNAANGKLAEVSRVADQVGRTLGAFIRHPSNPELAEPIEVDRALRPSGQERLI